MTEDNCPRVSSAESMAFVESSATKQRKKRKWDQPAELLVSAGVAVPGILPLGNVVSLAGINLPSAVSTSGVLLTNALTPKIHDELIAREIVINDADSAVRYKLTKRQTQDEIQKCTGAVVITRGKYHPPNAPPDVEKPLYLHISAGAHLETTLERIKAVDHAAAMVEEMLKQGSVTSVNNGGKVSNPLSTCVYLGFEADPSLNIAARICGPNDQFVNHIMNETGATVLLRGHGSGNAESVGEEGQKPLHLFLSSDNPKSLESAKLLAENLVDTISRECSSSRDSSCKVYGAVLLPQQLLNGVQSARNEVKVNISSTASFPSIAVNSAAIQPFSSVTHPGITTALHHGILSQSTGLSVGHCRPSMVCYPQSSLTGGTSYSGYGGIYPQATPLQQVALVLRQSPSLVNSTAAPATTAALTAINSSESLSLENKKRPPQKRKFQELPVDLKGPANPHQNSLQGSEFLKTGELASNLGIRNISTMPAPKKVVQSLFNGMPPPPPRTMPPPPRFNPQMPVSKVPEKRAVKKTALESVPDTLIKLMEYGDEDDEPDEEAEESHKNKSNSNGLAASKPFWAV